MSVVAGSDGWPAGYDYTVAGKTIRYDLNTDGFAPILHLKLYNPLDDHYGLAPLAAAQVALDTHNAAGFWNKALLDNAARPSGALVYDGPDGAHLSDAQFCACVRNWRKIFPVRRTPGGRCSWKAVSTGKPCR